MSDRRRVPLRHPFRVVAEPGAEPLQLVFRDGGIHRERLRASEDDVPVIVSSAGDVAASLDGADLLVRFDGAGTSVDTAFVEAADREPATLRLLGVRVVHAQVQVVATDGATTFALTRGVGGRWGVPVRVSSSPFLAGVLLGGQFFGHLEDGRSWWVGKNPREFPGGPASVEGVDAISFGERDIAALWGTGGDSESPACWVFSRSASDEWRLVERLPGVVRAGLGRSPLARGGPVADPLLYVQRLDGTIEAHSLSTAAAR